jgi:hypothetical protein
MSIPVKVDRIRLPQVFSDFRDYDIKLTLDAQQVTNLIDSLLFNIPVPPILVMETQPYQKIILVGHQRIAAICRVYKNEITFTKTEFNELEGFVYSELPQATRLKLDERRIEFRTLLLEKFNSSEVKRIARTVQERFKRA